MAKSATKEKWVFDPQDVVALLFDEEQSGMHAFEIPLMSYLLFIWALWPTNLHAEFEPKMNKKQKTILSKC
jgi:hypothetical protein